jgi:hypothetical protein
MTNNNTAATAQTIARRQNVLALINSAGSTFIGVDFVKADGSLRTMNVQTHAGKVKDDTTERSRRAVEARKARNPHILPVFDVANGAWRSINLDTVKRITMRGTTFVIDTNA